MLAWRLGLPWACVPVSGTTPANACLMWRVDVGWCLARHRISPFRCRIFPSRRLHHRRVSPNCTGPFRVVLVVSGAGAAWPCDLFGTWCAELLSPPTNGWRCLAGSSVWTERVFVSYGTESGIAGAVLYFSLARPCGYQSMAFNKIVGITKRDKSSQLGLGVSACLRAEMFWP